MDLLDLADRPPRLAGLRLRERLLVGLPVLHLLVDLHRVVLRLVSLLGPLLELVGRRPAALPLWPPLDPLDPLPADRRQRKE